ncbi:secreted RxLR effector protein 161-like [Rosa chinensis]|uniref:secreted RxLR effector protein 161-like n=1 Tax=Rosa chinensis TaxID=74649 RepID=UPI001AD8FB88|nr:secreted RxLR effector protein 161-like [Rosa chinensis]
MSKGDKLNKSQCPKNELEKEDIKNKPYSRLVGSLMYAQVCTRPDLAYAVGILARFQSNPGHEHWIAGKKVLRYLQKTKNYCLVYRKVDELEVVGYSDADFAGQYSDSGKSTSGYVFMLAGGAIAWKSVKQTQTAASTIMAEYIAIYEATSAVYFTKNNKRSTNSKHIDLKYYSVRERVKHKELEIVKIHTLKQLADPFTKPLTVVAFQAHAKNIGILPALDADF